MTTKRKSTITAPTYTRTSAMAKNSAFNNSQIPPALKNYKTKKSADKTGLREVITFKA